MKKLTLLSDIQSLLQAEQKERFYTRARFVNLLNRLKKNQRFYYGACLVLVFAIVQTACKKKETQIVPVVTISGLNKTSVHIGDTLIISGGNFNTTADKN